MRRGGALSRRLLSLGVLGAVAWTWAPAAGEPVAPDRRIAFYRDRTGGPGTYVAWARLGQAYLDRGHARGSTKDLERAERCLEQSLEYQSNLEALRGLAALRLEEHRFREALDLARDAVAAAPGDTGAQAALFDAQLALGQVEDATETVDGMLARSPSFEPLSRRALLERRLGDLDAALELMGRACEAAAALPEGGDSPAWCEAQRGELHRLRCEPELARQAYARALDLRPGHALTREHQAELLFAEGRLDEAGALYRGLLAGASDPLLRAALAEVLAAQGDSRRAAEERSAAVSRMRRSAAGGSLAFVRPLAFLLLDAPETIAEGLELAERDWLNRQDLLAADTLAWAKFRTGHPGEALEILEPFLDPRGVEAPILVRAATIHEAAKRPDDARKLLERLPACSSAIDPADRAAATALAASIASGGSR